MAKVDLRKLGVVFRREYLERVRSKWFLIGTLLGPVFLGVIMVLPAYISMKQGPGNDLTNVVVLDTTGTGLGARVGSALAKSFPAVPTPRVKLVTPERLAVAEDSAVNAVNAVIRKDINGLLVLDSNTVANRSVRYAGRNASSISDMQTLMSSVKQMGRASVVGQPVHLLSPLVPSTSLPVARGRGVRRAPAVHDRRVALTMSASDASCPRCSSRRIVLGELARGRTIGPAEPFGFRAFAARFSSLRNGARVQPAMAACAQCGLIWGQLSVDSLLTHLEKFPSEDVEAWLRHAHNTPL